MDELIINGETYIKKSSIKELPELSNNIVIACLQRGWIYVGRYKENGDECILNNAYCIRKWGTTKGIGELINGPTPSTILEFSGTVRWQKLTGVFTIDCCEDKWKSKI